MFDWFHSWPNEALVSVAQRFLVEVPNIEDSVRENVAYHMAYAHQCVTEASVRYMESFRRYNYTTPKVRKIGLYEDFRCVDAKAGGTAAHPPPPLLPHTQSYLELISLYKSLLDRKRSELKAAKERLENGVDKIAQASAQVSDLQKALKDEQIIVEEKKAQTDELIISIGKEKAIVDEAVEAGREDEESSAKLAAEVMAFQVLGLTLSWGFHTSRQAPRFLHPLLQSELCITPLLQTLNVLI